MAFDGLLLHKITDELNKTILKGRVNKLYIISKYELLMNIRSFNQNYKFIVSIHPSYARVQLSSLDYPTSISPNSLTMLFRKHLEGAYIESIKQISLDRILHITFIGTNEIKDTVRYHLYIEIMGKHSNCVLTYDNLKIIDCLKRVPPANNTVRYLTPGAQYVLPPLLKKNNPFTDEIATDDYVHTYLGFSKDLANEFEYRISLKESFKEIMNEIQNSHSLYITQENKTYYHCIELKHLHGKTKQYSLMDGLDEYYHHIDEKDRIKQQTSDLDKFIHNEYTKNCNKLKKLEKTLYDSENSDDYRIKGDLLFASLDSIHKGDTKVTVDNYYDNTKMTIDLDPKLDAKSNAKKYYAKYNKAKNSINVLHDRIKLTQEEIEYFENLTVQMSLADYYDALEIKEELENLGYLRKRQKTNAKKPSKQKKIRLTCFKPNENITLYVGKNNIQNEYLTFRFAGKNDMFFHVKDMPGSHCILKCDDLNEEAIRYAANAAAYFSKGKDSSSVPVNYASVKTLKKPANSKTGKVILSNYKTIYIDPDDGFLKDEYK